MLKASKITVVNDSRRRLFYRVVWSNNHSMSKKITVKSPIIGNRPCCGTIDLDKLGLTSGMEVRLYVDFNVRSPNEFYSDSVTYDPNAGAAFYTAQGHSGILRRGSNPFRINGPESTGGPCNC